MTREDALALAEQHDIDLFRVIRAAGRKDRDKAKAVSLSLAETIIAEAAAMRERAAAVPRQVSGIIGARHGSSIDSALCEVEAAIRALPATGEVGRG